MNRAILLSLCHHIYTAIDFAVTAVFFVVSPCHHDNGGEKMVKCLKILGGPGCGKSFELMQRYNAFLQSDLKPQDITLITFRKSSAEDLINMVSAQVPQSEKDLKKHVGTIHSICWRLSGYCDVLSPDDYTNFIKQFKYTAYMKTPQAGLDDDNVAFSGNLFDLYTWLRNTCTPVEKWTKYPGLKKITMPVSMVPQFIKNFEEYKKKLGKIDYSDMIQICIDKEIELDTKILMVDEFQDLTAQMFKLFNMWYPHCDHVIIAGDPSQSIYGYFGGSPSYFENFQAVNLRLAETHRLPTQVQAFAQRVLKSAGIIIEGLKAKEGYTQPIQQLSYNSKLPQHTSELHLIRCNYQAGAIAMSLAENGRVFTGIKKYAWTDDEIALANAIISIRNNLALPEDLLKSFIAAYPDKAFGGKKNRDELLEAVSKDYKSPCESYFKCTSYKNLALENPGLHLLPQFILDSVLSDDPTSRMQRKNKLFTAKIKGVISRSTPISAQERKNVSILTIHGSKGLEADAVFLHTAITSRIHSALLKPGKEMEAEARVWYVGTTRSREILYLVKDMGINYPLPQVATC